MSALDAKQLRITATNTAADEIARGHGDDDVDEAITHHLLTYGPDDLTLGELREIAEHTFQTATAGSITALSPKGLS